MAYQRGRSGGFASPPKHMRGKTIGINGGEVSLYDIWHAMPLHVFGGRLLEDLVQAETETERAFTVVDREAPSPECLPRAAPRSTRMMVTSG